MESQPWHVDIHAFALSDIDGDCKPSKIPLFKVSFWIRVYDLPLVG